MTWQEKKILQVSAHVTRVPPINTDCRDRGHLGQWCYPHWLCDRGDINVKSTNVLWINVTILSTSRFPTVLYFSDLSRQAGPSNLAWSWIMLLWLFPVWDLVAHAGREYWLEESIKQWDHTGWNLDLSCFLRTNLFLRHTYRAGWAGFELVYTTQMRLDSRLNSPWLTVSF